MRRGLFVLALATLIGANTWALVHVVRNRSGSPEAEVVLTERELPLALSGDDDSSLVLNLQWFNTAPEYGGIPRPGAGTPPEFLDQARLEQAGFDVSLDADAPDAERFYRSQRSREIYVALEYEGSAFEALMRDREATIDAASRYGPQIAEADRMRIERDTTSRLVIVDMDRDPARLRARWPDRHAVLILPGRARVVIDMGPPRRLRGVVTTLSIQAIVVPNTFRAALTARPARVGWTATPEGVVTITPPAYTVTLRVGSAYEPWVAMVEATPAAR